MLNIIKYIDNKKLELKTETKKAIKNFNNILISNFEIVDLENWNNNIGKLRVRYSLCKSNEPARYEIVNNMICIKNLNYMKCLPHELFHVASSYVKSNEFNCGFMSHQSDHIIGVGLNEGYTQLLTERYIDKDLREITGYYMERYYALMLEKLVGKRQMESLYLNGNLIGLIAIIFEYAKEDEIEAFLLGLDNITMYGNDLETIVHLNRILLSWCIRKNNIELEKQKIDKITHKTKILNFYNKLNCYTKKSIN